MSKTKGTVNVAFANEGAQSMSIDIVEKWEHDKKSTVGDTTFFKVGDSYVSMKTKDYVKIFG